MTEFEVTGPNGQKVIVTGSDPQKAARAAREYFRSSQPKEDVGAVAGTASAIADGMLMGLGDEYLAGLSAVVGLQPDGEGGSRFFQYDKPIGERYNAALSAIREEQQDFREDRPVLSFGGEVLGAVATPAAALGAAKTTAGAVGRASGLGALGGGTYAFNEGEGVADRVAAIPGGAVAGAILGPLSIPIAKAVTSARNKFGGKVASLIENSRFFRDGDFTGAGSAQLRRMGLDAQTVKRQIAADLRGQTGSATERQAAAELGEFGIPAYRKDVTGSVDDAAFFSGAQRGKFGDGTQRRIQDAADTQDRAMRGAADDISDAFSPTTPGQDAGDAAASVINRARNMEAEASRLATAAYKASEAAGMRLDDVAVKGLGPRLRSVLADADVSVDGTPAARILGDIEKWAVGSGPVSLRRVDSMRKRLNKAAIGATGDDAYVLGQLKTAYDDFLDDAVTAELFTGDAAALDKLKEARALFSDYARTFRGKDKASKFLQTMVDAEATPDQAAQWLFSAGKLGTGKMNANIAKSLRDTLGPDSQEWAMIRQAAFRKLTSKPEGMTQPGPQKISQDINDFLSNPATRALSEAMFTAEERALMRRYAAAVKRLVPPQGAVNYSNSGIENARTLRMVGDGLAASIGTAAGGPVMGAATAQGAGVARSARNFLKTQAALRGIQPSATGGRGATAFGAVSGGVVGPATTSQFQGQQE